MRRALLLVLASCGSDAVGDVVDAPSVDAQLDAPEVARCSGKSAQPLDAIWTLTHSNLQRTIRVHVPASYDPTRPTPVVLDFHGYTMTAQSQEDMTRLPAKSD